MGDTVREQQMAPGAVRMRRLRRTSALRALVRETPLAVADFIHPLFITAGSAFEKPIETMPGHSQRSVDRLDAEIDELVALGIPSVFREGHAEGIVLRCDELRLRNHENFPLRIKMKARDLAEGAE